MHPADEASFLQLVGDGAAASKKSSNDLQKGAAKATRDAGVCSLLATKDVTSWTGKIKTIDANGDGKGILTVQLADDIEVSTWNNFLSDAVDNTLIDPTSPVFNNILKMKKGDVVSFSGTFAESGTSDGECVEESSLTLRGKLESPSFILKFSDVTAA